MNASVSLSTSLSSLTDCTITTLASGHLLIYNGSKWVNSDTIPDSLLFIKDDVDGTKQMQFQLSGLTTGTTRTLTIPNASYVIVGDTNVQTLPNKTLTDTTNNILASSLKSTTTTIDISSATAPTNNQALIATGSTGATWQTINHLNISNIGTNSPCTNRYIHWII